MPKTVPASLSLALSAMLLLACGGDSDVARDEPAEMALGCSERDGAWFGRSEGGAMIMSQTQEACEERLRN